MGTGSEVDNHASSKAGWELRRSLVRSLFTNVCVLFQQEGPTPPGQSPGQGVASRGQSLWLMWPALPVTALT